MDALSRLVKKMNAVAAGRVASPTVLATIRAYMSECGYDQGQIDALGTHGYFCDRDPFCAADVCNIVAHHSDGQAFEFGHWGIDDYRRFAEKSAELGPGLVVAPYEFDDGVILIRAGEIERLLNADAVPQFCTTERESYANTAPDSAFGEVRVGWLPGRGHACPCEPSISGYLDGRVEEEAGFDVPVHVCGEVLVDRDAPVEVDCRVWVDRETAVDCVMVVWPEEGAFVCWIGDGGWHHPTPEAAHTAHKHVADRRVVQRFRHFIVAKDDVRALAHARECAAQRKRII